MTNNKFGNLRTRVVGDIAGYPVIGINTMPMLIDGCSVLINFAQTQEESSSSALKLNAIEQALLSTYVPGTASAPVATEQNTVPASRLMRAVSTVEAAEFKQLLAEGAATFMEVNLSVDL